MPHSLSEFREERERMNERVLEVGNLGIKRFFALDAQAYEDGALSGHTKELLGLAASAVLRCDDCITYHLIRCVEEGVTDDEIMEAMNVALVVGSVGSPKTTLEPAGWAVTLHWTSRGRLMPSSVTEPSSASGVSSTTSASRPAATTGGVLAGVTVITTVSLSVNSWSSADSSSV